MTSLNNVSVKTKLILILFFPILGLIIFASLQSYDYYNKYTSMQKVETLVLLSVNLSKLVHETQKERGMTAGFLGSKGKKFIKKLPEQREKVNTKRDELLNYLKDFDASAYSQEFQKTLQAGLSQLENVDSIRGQVSSQSIAIGKAITYYTNMNGSFLLA